MFCPNCGNRYQGTPRFCENCGLALRPRLAERPNEPRFLYWCRNHLNWTLVIALLPITAATFTAQSLADSYIVNEVALSAVLWPIFGSSIILTAIVGGWVLNHKGRNPWWLLPGAAWGIGWIVWLVLDNKRQAAGQVR